MRGAVSPPAVRMLRKLAVRAWWWEAFQPFTAGESFAHRKRPAASEPPFHLRSVTFAEDGPLDVVLMESGLTFGEVPFHWRKQADARYSRSLSFLLC
jgi:hypothetical protein